jgi:hypothetical protein
LAVSRWINGAPTLKNPCTLFNRNTSQNSTSHKSLSQELVPYRLLAGKVLEAICKKLLLKEQIFAHLASTQYKNKKQSKNK